MATHLVWFRNDLRLHDNLALAAACRQREANVIGLFIATPAQWQQHGMSPRQAWFIRQHLRELRDALAKRGIPLYTHCLEDFGACISWIAAFCEKHRVDVLFYNYQYELNERRRDAAVEKQLDGDVICQGFDDSVLLAPGSVLTDNRDMYKVYTPFRRTFLRRFQNGLPECVKAPEARTDAPCQAPPFAAFDYPVAGVDDALFPVGETPALMALRQFCRGDVADYDTQRDFPVVDGTSRLSPYLAIGVLSPRQCLHRLLTEHPKSLESGAGAVWLNELIWREFYRHLLAFYPALCRHQPFIPWTKQIAWSDDVAHLSAWQQGKTGYPIVDAAMRQLNETGWMHNRLRMVTASFLVKDLLIDWRKGEHYFISNLIDGDVAANNGGWQWAASTGTDAVPWFRIFNPTTQGKKFDAKGAFIRRWLPELREVPNDALHEPWQWAETNGVKLNYPRPIVDHKQARAATLAAYEIARTSQGKTHEKQRAGNTDKRKT